MAYISITLLVIAIVASAASMLLAKKPFTPRLLPQALENVPVAEQGKRIPVVFGRRFVRQPNVVWYGRVRPEPITMMTGGMSASSGS